MKRLLFSFVALLIAMISNAQIGYQVSLLNTATGEPRANETVTCQIELTNSEGAVICSETKSATSNDFGVLSLSVGNATTFEQMDWSKLPLYVSVSIGGKLVGQSQVLTVPVAEHAKHYGTLTYENIGEKEVVAYEFLYNEFLSGTEYYESIKLTYTFNSDKKVKYKYTRDRDHNRTSEKEYEGTYRIDGNAVFGYFTMIFEDYKKVECFWGHYSPEDDKIYIMSNIEPLWGGH